MFQKFLFLLLITQGCSQLRFKPIGQLTNGSLQTLPIQEGQALIWANRLYVEGGRFQVGMRSIWQTLQRIVATVLPFKFY